ADVSSVDSSALGDSGFDQSVSWHVNLDVESNCVPGHVSGEGGLGIICRHGEDVYLSNSIVVRTHIANRDCRRFCIYNLRRNVQRKGKVVAQGPSGEMAVERLDNGRATCSD